MARLGDVYKSSFIKATRDGDIDCDACKGEREVTLTIKSSEVGKVGQGDEEREQIVVHFAETEQTLGLNVTNARSIQNIAGSDDTDDWTGKRIELFVVPEQRSPTGNAIRVRSPRGPKQTVKGNAEPMGQTFADALDAKMLGLGRDDNHLRAWLVGHKYASEAQVAGLPATWPKSIVPQIKEFLADADPKVPEPTNIGPTAPMTDADVPF